MTKEFSKSCSTLCFDKFTLLKAFLECKNKSNYNGAVISDSEGTDHERKMSCEEIVAHHIRPKNSHMICYFFGTLSDGLPCNGNLLQIVLQKTKHLQNH